RGEALWVIVPPRGLEAPLPSPAAFRRQVLALAPGDALDREALVEHLHAAGYERVETGTAVGQWGLRGGIVDIFSPAGSLPVRLELAGDEVESLRTFDPTTQRSTGAVATLLVLPTLGGEGEASARLAGCRRARGARGSAARGLWGAPARRARRLPPRDALDRGSARPVPPARARARGPAGGGLPGAAPGARPPDGRPPPGDPPGPRARGPHRARPPRPRAP